MFTFYFMFTLSTFDWKASRCIYRSFIQISYTDFNTRFVLFTSFFLTYNFDQAPVDTIPLPYLQLKLIERTSERTQRLMNYLLSAFSVVKINKLRKIVYIRVI